MLWLGWLAGMIFIQNEKKRGRGFICVTAIVYAYKEKRDSENYWILWMIGECRIYVEGGNQIWSSNETILLVIMGFWSYSKWRLEYQFLKKNMEANVHHNLCVKSQVFSISRKIQMHGKMKGCNRKTTKVHTSY